VYIPQKQTTTSPRARELSRKLEQTIEEFERHYLGTSRSDIHQALQALDGGVPAQQRSKAMAIVLVIAGLLGLLVALLFASGA
jgi:hypothetical protein